MSVAVGTSAPAVSNEFYGVRLGETLIQLRLSLGTPAMIWHSETGDFWRYHIDNARAWRVAIIQRNLVVGAYVRQALDRTSHLSDRAGLALNDSQTKMFLLRGTTEPLAYMTYDYPTSTGVHRLYEISNGVVTGMGVTRSYSYALPPLVTWDRRDGQAPYRAFRLSRFDRPVQRAESRIVLEQSCNNSGVWSVVKSTRFKLDGRLYDRVLAACSVPVYRRNFYFDVTDLVSKSQ
jgi:hypothetical protein